MNPVCDHRLHKDFTKPLIRIIYSSRCLLLILFRAALKDPRNPSQASHVLPRAEATMASFLQPELSQDFDIIVQEVQNLKDKGLTQRLIDRNHKQELERDIAACRAEISQPKAPFTMSDEEVSEKFQGIRRSLAQWVEGLPKFPRCALKRQAVGDSMQNGSYTRYPYP